MLLLTVMITGTVALTISLHLAFRGMHELDMGFAASQSLESLALAEGCREEALLQLIRDPHYTGGTLALGDGTCVIAVTEEGSEATIAITATIDRWTRHLMARVALSGPRIRLLEWSETGNP
jgi:hypothetical protein